MIQKQVLKQVAIVGAAALVFLHRASGAVEKDIKSVKEYARKRVHSIKEEIKIRADFLKKAKTFKCKEVPYEMLSSDLEKGRTNLSKIKEHLAIFDKSVQDVLKKADQLIYFLGFEELPLGFASVPEFNRKMEETKNELLSMIPPMLDKNDLAISAMKEFDSHMLRAITRYITLKDEASLIPNSILFKLANKNKPLAITIIYSLFLVDTSRPTQNDVISAMNYLAKKADTYFSSLSLDYVKYINAMRYDIDHEQVDLMKAANRHIDLLFNMSRVSSEAIQEEALDIYLGLLNKHITKTALEKYIDITPGQIAKIIMIEYAITMNGCLMDYRKNSFFCALKELIVRIGKPSSSTGLQKDVNEAHKKQEEILNIIYLLWNEQEPEEDPMDEEEPMDKILQDENIKLFCTHNGVSLVDFKTIQKTFMRDRWIYKLDLFSPSSGGSASGNLPSKAMHFDISYTHPMCYIYLRCEDMSHLGSPNAMKLYRNPFMERGRRGVVFLRLYKVGKTDSDAVREENIKSCIRTWFLPRVEVFIKKEDAKSYLNIADDFCKYFRKSMYMVEVGISEITQTEKQNTS
ncbi:hypothetical protein NEMIN01_0347 [Nematocida minor]|uniref:uncharacterized protein n=1 Tax=Nematocida minor TaxID=1912983 RepID=UPI0022200610|nr:uncharacterized protein NEMIN01_0347 [Nematocida minor]KAI5189181.1 hypothetical protein NEMIN01_0347 [Nematocida minor]